MEKNEVRRRAYAQMDPDKKEEIQKRQRGTYTKLDEDKKERLRERQRQAYAHTDADKKKKLLEQQRGRYAARKGTSASKVCSVHPLTHLLTTPNQVIVGASRLQCILPHLKRYGGNVDVQPREDIPRKMARTRHKSQDIRRRHVHIAATIYPANKATYSVWLSVNDISGQARPLREHTRI